MNKVFVNKVTEIDGSVKKIIDSGLLVADSFQRIGSIIRDTPEFERPILIAKLEADPRGRVILKMMDFFLTHK